MSDALVIAVAGIRDIAPASESLIPDALHRLCQRASGFVFGGARGTDTLALAAAARLYPAISRVVIVPGTVDQQPAKARAAIERYATEIVELHLPMGFDLPRHVVADSLDKRNGAMLDRSGALLAFHDGTGKGGTANMIRKADGREMPVKRVQVERF